MTVLCYQAKASTQVTVSEIYDVRSDLVHFGNVQEKKEQPSGQRFWEAFQ